MGSAGFIGERFAEGPAGTDRREPRGAAPYPDLDAAQKFQESLRKRCIIKRTIGTDSVKSVAGADAAYSTEDVAYAAVVVMSFPGAGFIEASCSVRPAGFPYIPGLFALREGPPIADSVRSLPVLPDVLIVHGHGYAHPRRAGLATIIGVLMEWPTVGVAKSLLTGKTSGRGKIRNVYLRDQIEGLCVRDGRTFYASSGNMISIAEMRKWLKDRNYEYPEELLRADAISKELRVTSEAEGPS